MKVIGLNGRPYYMKPNLIKWTGKSRSQFQFDCKTILASFWGNDIVAEEQAMPGSKLRFDFVNFSKKIILEADGEQHSSYNKFFHNKNIFNFAKSLERDQKKVKFAEKNGFTHFAVKSTNELHRIMLELNK